MRFIIREQPYEQVLAAGQLQYSQHGEGTGATETWRLTAAVSGYRFLRVDVDARTAPSGHTTLYHLVLNEQNQPERLRYRFWHDALTISGNVLFEGEMVTASREVNGVRYEDAIPVTAPTPFWFPSTVGLGLLAREQGRVQTIKLDTHLTPLPDAFHLVAVTVHLTRQEETAVAIMGQMQPLWPHQVEWADQRRTIWLDRYDQPLKMVREDGLTAVETRYIRY